jgi:uncharacterized protein
MKIVLPGGSGQVGTILARALSAAGHEVVVLSRRPGTAPWRVMQWDAHSLGPWCIELDGAAAVINLAGRSVNCRYNARNRLDILASRLDSTRAVGQAIARAARPPHVWLQASTATIYADRYDADNDEATGLLGGCEPEAASSWRFSIQVATEWERTLEAAVVPHTRKLALRSALTLSPDRGGIFDVLLGLVRHGLGGRAGTGRQYVSWLHEHDLIRAVLWLIEHEEIAGPVNLAAPQPLPNAEFMRILRHAWGIKVGLPAPRWLLEIGTFLMRTESELVLKSRRVVPRRLLESGFTFRFPSWPAAADDLCGRWRTSARNQAAAHAE